MTCKKIQADLAIEAAEAILNRLDEMGIDKHTQFFALELAFATLCKETEFFINREE